jgi:hypothetical protein
LEQIKTFFGIGIVRVNNIKNTVTYSVTKLNDLVTIIIPHFKNYPLFTQKSVDFSLWCNIISIIENGGHLTKEGLNEIISIKSALN